MTTNTEPTAEELAAAEAVLARKAIADAARLDETKAALRPLVALPAFTKVLDEATRLKAAQDEGSQFHAHLNAIVVGMTSLRNDAA